MNKRIWLCILIISLTSFRIFSQPIESTHLFSSYGFSSVKISPDGKYVSALYSSEEGRFLELIDPITNKFVTNTRVPGDSFIKFYNWLDSTTLYLKIEYENSNIIVIGKIEEQKLHFSYLSLKGYLVDTLPLEPQRVLFSKKKNANATEYKLYDVSLNDLVSNDFSRARLIEYDGEKVSQYIYDRQFNKVIALVVDQDSGSVLFRSINFKGSKWRDIIKLKNEDYQLTPVGFKDANTLAVLTNKDTDKVVLRAYDIDSQSLAEIIYQHPDYDLTSAKFLSDGKLHSVTYVKHGLSRSDYFDKGSDKLDKALLGSFKNKEAYLVGSSREAQSHLLYVNGSDEPGEYFVWDKSQNILRSLFKSKPNLNHAEFYPSKLIRYNSEDGQELEAFLTLPGEINHHTLLVKPHGGPIGIKEVDRFNSEVQYYASRGFSVLRVNFRGSSGFGKSFQEQGVGEFGKLIEKDIMSAVDIVTNKHKFNKMCSIGASYGGFSAAMLAITHPDRFDCVVGAFGIYDLPLLFNASNYRSGKEREEYISRTVGKFDGALKEQSPVYLFEKLEAPILLIAGKKDDIADFEHSNRFEYLLRKNDHDVEKIFYDNAGHGHKYWEGDRHEAAITYDYLIRTLGLKYPSPSSLKDAGKKAIAKDLAAIADAYSFDYGLELNKRKGMKYYEKAANYEHGRSVFNIAAQFHRGDNRPLDLTAAWENYQKSASFDYHSAFARMGRMYMEGEYVSQDWDAAYDNLTQAVKLEPDYLNNLRLARFYCIAPKPHRNFDKCLKLLNLRQYAQVSKSELKNAKNQLRHEAAWILIEGKLSKSELAEVQNVVNQYFGINTQGVSIDSSRSGLYKYVEGESFLEDWEYKLIKQTEQIRVSKDSNLRFGTQFNIDIPGINRYRNVVGIVARWIKTSKDGRVEYPETVLLYSNPKTDWRMIRKLKSVEAGETWKLELFDMEQKQLFSHQFLFTK